MRARPRSVALCGALGWRQIRTAALRAAAAPHVVWIDRKARPMEAGVVGNWIAVNLTVCESEREPRSTGTLAAVLSVLSPLRALPLSAREFCGDVRLHLLQQNLSLLRR